MKNIDIVGCKAALIIMVCVHLHSQIGNAQSYLQSDGKLHTISPPGQVIDNATDSTVYDFLIPASADGKILYLLANGADGGANTSDKRNGGGGATVSGMVKVGNGDNELPVGSKVRFIIGRHGDSGYNHGGGGGGTGIVALPKGSATWEVLLAAGGGGGAGDDLSGRDAVAGTSGGWGLSESNEIVFRGGDNGKGGNVGNDQYRDGGAGGGYLSDGEGLGRRGGKKARNDDGVPVGGRGGYDARHGGFGFGGGGAGRRIDPLLGSVDHCGGGGGYSGGGGSFDNGPGGGGGSYLGSSYLLPQKVWFSNRGTLNPQQGFAEYQIHNNIYQAAAAHSISYLALKNNTTFTLQKTGYGDDFDNGLILQLWNRDPANRTNLNNKLWYYDRGNQNIRLVAALQKCIDVKDAKTNNGNTIQLYDCKGTAAQQWFYEDGLLKPGLDKRKCLILKNKTLENKNPAVIWDCDDPNISNDQKEWIFTADFAEAAKYLALEANSNYSLHKSGSITNYSNKLELQLWPRDPAHRADANNKLWTYDDSHHTIQLFADPSKCIDLTASNTTNGTPILVYDCHGGPNQEWFFENGLIKSGYNRDKCLILKNNALENKNPAVIWDCNDSSINNTQKKWSILSDDL